MASQQTQHDLTGLVSFTDTVSDAFRQGVVALIGLVTGQQIWDPSMRYLTELPAKTDPVEVIGIVVMALTFSVLATLYPAFKAASTDPVQVLRYE